MNRGKIILSIFGLCLKILIKDREEIFMMSILLSSYQKQGSLW